MCKNICEDILKHWNQKRGIILFFPLNSTVNSNRYTPQISNFGRQFKYIYSTV